MPRYKAYDYDQLVTLAPAASAGVIPLSLENQLEPGTLEYTIHSYLIGKECFSIRDVLRRFEKQARVVYRSPASVRPLNSMSTKLKSTRIVVLAMIIWVSGCSGSLPLQTPAPTLSNASATIRVTPRLMEHNLQENKLVDRSFSPDGE